ncbi:MAG: hypothetical protein FWF15_05175 [Oscillospiraceae bacterium]|nr:hypothetical protein [Oscillospiraceae bacterium]
MKDILKYFKDPQKEYYPVNMWFWDDKITEDEISFQLDKFLEMGIYQIFIHPMWGTTVDYLSHEFFTLIAYAVAEMKKRGQKFWIYDEFNWPSGPAGGKLLRDKPWTRGKVLRVRDIMAHPGYNTELLLPGRILAIKRGTDDVTDQCEIYKIDIQPTADWHRVIINNKAVNEYLYKIFYIENEKSVTVTDVWAEHSNYTEGYLDALNPKAIQAFIEYTHEKYKQYIGDEFGETVIGVFTDEPCITSIGDYEASGIPWYDELEEDFQAWSGYDIKDRLELLYLPGVTDEIRNIKIHFWRFLSFRFQKVFIAAMKDWCEDNNLLLTGHMCGEEGLWSNMMQSVDIYRDLSEFHLPGIDSIFSKQSIDTPNYNIAGKILSSAGRFYNKRRLLCETYTGSGWDLRFSDMRRIANRLILLGVNMIQYMGSYYTLDNMRKLLPICYPPSHSYNNPLMSGYKPFGEYVARLQYLSEMTRPKGKVLVVMPTLASFAMCKPLTVLMGYYDTEYSIKHMDVPIETAVNALLAANIEYDLASDTLADALSIENGKLKFYGSEYDWLVLPAMHCTDEKMNSIISEHDKIFFINQLAEFPVENKLEKIESGAYNLSLDIKLPHAELEKYAENVFRDLMGEYIALSAEHNGGVLISERTDNTYFIVNDTAEYKDIAGILPNGNCIFLDPETGGICAVETNGLKFKTVLAPYECTVLTEADVAQSAPHIGRPCGETIRFDGNWNFNALGDNVLIPVKSLIKQDGTVFPTDGYDFPKESFIGTSDLFQVFGTFDVADVMPLKLMFESTLVHDIIVNGHVGLEPYDKKIWGIDNKEVDITEYINTGKNKIWILCKMPDWVAPFKLPFFAIKGDFRLNEANEIAESWTDINPASWTEQGFRYYTGKGKYWNSFTVGKDFQRILLDVPTLDPAEVVINGKTLPKRYWSPFTFDMTEFVTPGSNKISIIFDTCYSNLLDKPVESGMISEPVIYLQ